LISRKHTNREAAVLYAFFGLHLLYIAWRYDSKNSQQKIGEANILDIKDYIIYFPIEMSNQMHVAAKKMIHSQVE